MEAGEKQDEEKSSLLQSSTFRFAASRRSPVCLSVCLSIRLSVCQAGVVPMGCGAFCYVRGHANQAREIEVSGDQHKVQPWHLIIRPNKPHRNIHSIG